MSHEGAHENPHGVYDKTRWAHKWDRPATLLNVDESQQKRGGSREVDRRRLLLASKANNRETDNVYYSMPQTAAGTRVMWRPSVAAGR